MNNDVYLIVYDERLKALIKAKTNLNYNTLFWKVVDSLKPLNDAFIYIDYSITQKAEYMEVAIHLLEYKELSLDLPTIWNKIVEIIPALKTVPDTDVEFLQTGGSDETVY